ncbi:MAG: hypothetical protein EOO60_05310 [Hymenobacter sp.]|nr:MAG: hypothetical protein EOO60_05310 [Hymenobacter sp.]
MYINHEAAATSGRSENFTRFLHEELTPHVDSLYQTTFYRLLAGQSLGGLFVLNTLLHYLA